MQIELVYEKSCPNIAAAREQLLRAFATLGRTPRWTEWEIGDPSTPAHARVYGSPTVLVDGHDATGEPPADTALCCRVYGQSDAANRGVPSLEALTRALNNARQDPVARRDAGRWGIHGGVLPAVGAAMLPKLACPACWPAYTGLLSSLGLGFADYTPYLLPLTLLFVVTALFSLAHRASTRRGWGPFTLGSGAVVVLLAGKFLYENDVALYTGIGLLVGASLWNSWPRRLAPAVECAACTPRSE